MKISSGTGNSLGVVSGKLTQWQDVFFVKPGEIENNIIVITDLCPLYLVAFIAGENPSGVLIIKGGKNFHPLIFLTDAFIPAIAGINKDLSPYFDKNVTINSYSGDITDGLAGNEAAPKTYSTISEPSIFVNVGLAKSFEKANLIGVAGIGLLRTEFIAVQLLSKVLSREFEPGVSVLKALEKSNEADVLYSLFKKTEFHSFFIEEFTGVFSKAIELFGNKPVIVRTIDLPRSEEDQMGNRGIRRCLLEGGESIKILALSIKNAIEKKQGNIGIILPLVSHYSQITDTFSIIKKTGLSTKELYKSSADAISFGWEIEQPAASISCELWVKSFKIQTNESPSLIGIGTNDLTQFTLAVGRDAYSGEFIEFNRKYLQNLYNEKEFSIIKQIVETNRICKSMGIELFLLGQAASNSLVANLMLDLNIKLSVSVSALNIVNEIHEKYLLCEDKGSGINNYIDYICCQYESNYQEQIRQYFERFFEHEKNI